MPKIKPAIQHHKPRKDIKGLVMAKISSNEIKMKPKWIFVMGSILTLFGLVGLTFGAIFLINLTLFLARKRGMGYGRLEMMLDSFPVWIPLLAVLGLIFGIWMLKKYDFSYKNNFPVIALIFVIIVFASAVLVDQLGLNDVWSSRGPMRRFYQQIEISTK